MKQRLIIRLESTLASRIRRSLDPSRGPFTSRRDNNPHYRNALASIPPHRMNNTNIARDFSFLLFIIFSNNYLSDAARNLCFSTPFLSIFLFDKLLVRNKR